MTISIEIYSALSALKEPEQLTKVIALGYVARLQQIDEKVMRDSLNECEVDVREEYAEFFEKNIHIYNECLYVGKMETHPIKTDEAKAVANELHRIICIIQRIGKRISIDDAVIFTPTETPPYNQIFEYLKSEGVVSEMHLTIFIEHIKRCVLSGIIKGRNKTKMIYCAYRLSRFFPDEWKQQAIYDLEVDEAHFSNCRGGEYYKNFPI